jgi:hypothetical protein
MTEVTKEQFFTEIREKKLDLIVTVTGNYPYTDEFKYRDGRIWGKIVNTPDLERKSYPFYTTQYFKM